MKLIGKILNFAIYIIGSLLCPTFDHTKEDLEKMGIVKGYLPDEEKEA